MGWCTAYPGYRTSDALANRKERNGQPVREMCRRVKNIHGQTLSGEGGRKLAERCMREYNRTEHNNDYGLESNEKTLLGLRQVVRRFEAAQRERRNEQRKGDILGDA